MLGVVPEVVNLSKRDPPRRRPERRIWSGDSSGGGIPAGRYPGKGEGVAVVSPVWYFSSSRADDATPARDLRHDPQERP